MNFTQYPSRSAAAKHENGTVRRGQYLSAAPGGHWIIPLDRIATDPKVALLGHKYPGSENYYVIASEQNRPGQ